MYIFLVVWKKFDYFYLDVFLILFKWWDFFIDVCYVMYYFVLCIKWFVWGFEFVNVLIFSLFLFNLGMVIMRIMCGFFCLLKERFCMKICFKLGILFWCCIYFFGVLECCYFLFLYLYVIVYFSRLLFSFDV